jgi:hypothetical protein
MVASNIHYLDKPRYYGEYWGMFRKALEEIQAKQTPDGFVKVAGKPALALTDEQKVVLNRKANVLFNEGHIEDAKRIYLTTGYSDGLSRVADTYLSKKRTFDALELYMRAHNQRQAGPLVEKLAAIISNSLREAQ